MNRAVLEVTSGVRVADGGADFDVDQAGDVILTHDRSTSRVILVDGRTNRSQGEFIVPVGAQVRATESGAVIFESDPMRIWSLPLDTLLAIADVTSESPTLVTDSAGIVTLTADGSVAAFDLDAGSLQWIDGQVADPAGRSDVDLDAELLLSTAIGDTIVYTTSEGLLAVSPGEAPRNLGELDGLGASTLQQASVDTSALQLVDGEGGLVEIDLSDGAATPIARLGGSGPLPFIVHGGCSFVVTTSPQPLFEKFCEGELVEAAELVGAGAELRLRLVNGWVWINDVETGGAWITSPESELSRIDDWGAALANDNLDESDATTEDGGGIEEVRVNPDAEDAELVEADELDEDDENEPPVIRDDEAETRIDRPVIIPVLVNDEDVDGDVLLITDVSIDGPPGVLVSITPSRDSVQLSPPAGYIGPISFTYSASDGRGGSGSATVDVDVTSGSIESNRPPEPTTDVASARAGSPVSLDVLVNDSDPDGDSLVLLDVEIDGGTVVFDPSGQVTFTPDTTGTDARIELDYTVADDFGAVADGLIIVNVRLEEANSSPDARNDSAVTSVGNPAELNVLDNDSDPDDDPLIVARQPVLISDPSGPAAEDNQSAGASITADGEFFFIPEEPGTYLFEYLISDGQNNDRARVRVDVTASDTNEAPVAVRDDVTIPVGGTRLVYALDNDGDPNGDVVGIVEWSGTQGLIVEEIPGIGFRVTVEPSAPERATFRYAISDGVNEPVGTVVVVAVVDVEPVNQPPVVQGDSAEIRTGRTSTIPVLVNDYDPEGGSLVITRAPEIQGVDATFDIGPDGQTITVTLGPDVESGFSFGYEVADQNGASSAAVVDVRVIGPEEPNRPPVARPDTARTIEDVAVEIDVLANDTDPDGDAIQVESIASQPGDGVVTIGVDGTIRYEPSSSFTGTDRFDYVLIDTEGARTVGIVRIGVTAEAVENRPPSANPDRFVAIAGGEPLVLDVLANDFDPDNDPLSVLSITSTSSGQLAQRSDGAIVFTPPDALDDEPIETSFIYSISDGAGNESETTVTISIESAPDPIAPVAVNDQAGPVRARTEVTVDVLANDLDPDGDVADLVVSSADPAAQLVGGQLVVVAQTESSQHSYTITDGDGLSSTATLTVFVVDNEAPTVTPTVVSTPFETSIELDLAPQASDVDDDPLFFVCCDNARGGVATITASGEGVLTVVFEPSPDFSGDAGFAYSVDDQQGHLVSGSVAIEVLPPDNRPPVAEAGSMDVEAGSLERGVRVPFDLSGLVSDPDAGDVVIFSVGSAPAPLDLAVAGSQITLAAPVDAAGTTASIDFTVTDAAGESASGTLAVTVTPVSDPPPQTVADTASTNQGQAVEIDVLGNDVDPLGQGLTLFQVGSTVDGTTTAGSTPGSILFTPNNDYFGTTAFTYTIRDATNSDTRETVGQVTVDVTGRPESPAPPAANADNAVATITWSTPVDNGAPIDDYLLEYEDLTGGGAQSIAIGAQNSHTWTGLTNGHEYRFRVQAHNVAGWSEWSGWSAPVRPDTIPDTPATPTIAFGDGQLSVAWTAPSNQGSAITGYQLEIGGGSNQVITLGAGTTYDWAGLDNGVEYQFRVAAVNAAGDSDWSGWSVSEHPLGPPLGPPAPVASRGDRFLDVTWSPPDNNGDAIISYELEIQSGGSVTVAGGGTTDYRWANLANGVEQQFRVRAVNRAPQPGDWSDWSTPVTPCAEPDQPAAPTVVRGDTEVVVSWSAPDDQGCAITSYAVVANGSITRTAGAGASSLTFTGLTNGTSYTFTVMATNEVGDSAVSSASASVVPAGPPTPPTISSATPSGVGQIDVAYGAASPNGSPITSYEISTNSGGAVPIGGSPHTVSGLAESTGYGFRVRACNDVGCSLWSGTVNATTWGRPSVPLGVNVVAGNARGDASWSAPANGGGEGVLNYEIQLSGSNATTVDASTRARSWTGLTNDQQYTFTVRACNSSGCSNPASVTFTPVPPPPVVSISRGSVYNSPECTDPSCRRIFVNATNFRAGENITIRCYSTFSGPAFATYFRVADGNGSHSGEQCFYGIPGQTVWVTVQGTTTALTQSNSIFW